MDKPTELDKMDPAAGLALLSDRPGETSEQRRKRLFWKFMFAQRLAWLAGDTLAIARAVAACSRLHEPPPRWLEDAINTHIDRRMSAAEKRQQRDLASHLMRWEAVLLARGGRPWDARNNEGGMPWDDCWPAASDMLAGTEAESSAETVRGSYKLIQKAGGEHTTLETYRRALRRADSNMQRRLLP
jgi:hypothetical protein